jgi:glycopeptide antibiotics resistance protein
MASGRNHLAAPVLLAVYGMLIVYVSLYPFQTALNGPDLLQSLRHLTWAHGSKGDLLNNLLLYMPFGFCAALLVEPRFGRTAGIVFATLLGAGLSLYMELLQAGIAPRVSSLTDVAVNAAGALIGGIAGSVWHVFGERITPMASTTSRSATVPIALVVLWLTARLWPIVPDPRLGQLKRAVRPLFEPHIGMKELAGFLLAWLIVSQAVFSIGARQRAVDLLLITIATVLIGRAVTAGNTLVAAEIAAIVLLLPSLVLSGRLDPRMRAGLFALLLFGWLGWPALAPLMHGSGVATTLPSLQALVAGPPPPPAQLAGKAFNYLALGWLLAGAGLGRYAAALLTVLSVGAFTFVQLNAPEPIFTWVDVLLAAAAALLVARWMAPAASGSAGRSKPAGGKARRG